MEYYGNNDWRDYLAHYGVKGMKWRKHKYVQKIGDFYKYNITGQGYLEDADRYSARARAANKRADAASGIHSTSAFNRMYTNRRVAGTNTNKAEEAYSNYKTRSLAGRLSRNTPGISQYSYTHTSGLKKTGYDANNPKYANLSKMKETRKSIKKRQRKEKAKNILNKLFGK